eukprot:762539-Hanusia_phi.AAC.11
MQLVELVEALHRQALRKDDITTHLQEDLKDITKEVSLVKGLRNGCSTLHYIFKMIQNEKDNLCAQLTRNHYVFGSRVWAQTQGINKPALIARGKNMQPEITELQDFEMHRAAIGIAYAKQWGSDSKDTKYKEIDTQLQSSFRIGRASPFDESEKGHVSVACPLQDMDMDLPTLFPQITCCITQTTGGLPLKQATLRFVPVEENLSMVDHTPMIFRKTIPDAADQSKKSKRIFSNFTMQAFFVFHKKQQETSSKNQKDNEKVEKWSAHEIIEEGNEISMTLKRQEQGVESRCTVKFAEQRNPLYSNKGFTVFVPEEREESMLLLSSTPSYTINEGKESQQHERKHLATPFLKLNFQETKHTFIPKTQGEYVVQTVFSPPLCYSVQLDVVAYTVPEYLQKTVMPGTNAAANMPGLVHVNKEEGTFLVLQCREVMQKTTGFQCKCKIIKKGVMIREADKEQYPWIAKLYDKNEIPLSEDLLQTLNDNSKDGRLQYTPRHALKLEDCRCETRVFDAETLGWFDLQAMCPASCHVGVTVNGVGFLRRESRSPKHAHAEISVNPLPALVPVGLKPTDTGPSPMLYLRRQDLWCPIVDFFVQRLDPYVVDIYHDLYQQMFNSMQSPSIKDRNNYCDCSALDFAFPAKFSVVNSMYRNAQSHPVWDLRGGVTWIKHYTDSAMQRLESIALSETQSKGNKEQTHKIADVGIRRFVYHKIDEAQRASIESKMFGKDSALEIENDLQLIMNGMLLDIVHKRLKLPLALEDANRDDRQQIIIPHCCKLLTGDSHGCNQALQILFHSSSKVNEGIFRLRNPGPCIHVPLYLPFYNFQSAKNVTADVKQALSNDAQDQVNLVLVFYNLMSLVLRKDTPKAHLVIIPSTDVNKACKVPIDQGLFITRKRNKIVVMRSHSKIQQHWEKDMDRVGVRDVQDDIAVSGGETLFSKYEITDYTDLYIVLEDTRCKVMMAALTYDEIVEENAFAYQTFLDVLYDALNDDDEDEYSVVLPKGAERLMVDVDPKMHEITRSLASSA